MKCRKCGYITFDYLDNCPRCQTPVPKEIAELYPLRFRPRPLDFTRDYMETLTGVAFMGQGPSTNEAPPEEVPLEELVLEEGPKGTLVLPGAEKELPQTDGGEPSIREWKGRTPPSIPLKEEEISLKGEPLELELESIPLEAEKEEGLIELGELEIKESSEAAEEVQGEKLPLLQIETIGFDGGVEGKLNAFEERPKGKDIEDEIVIEDLRIEDLKLEEEDDEEIDMPIGIKLEDNK
ncbi:MAG: hypothetical protein ACK4WB_09030 [Desulfatiglandales bacterium]